ncbi:MAG: ribosome silencing factor [bacterium]
MSKKDSNKSAIGQAKTLAQIISDKKGEDIIIFDLREISPITDFFVIATGLSNTHNKAIAEYLIEYKNPYHSEGMEEANWVLLDYIDVIVHIFSKEAREFYGLERLWGDAPQVKI